MNSNMTDLPLGKSVSYPSGYDAALLFPISRAEARTQIGIAASSALPFSGWDLWNAYEMSWLNLKGLPQVALLRVKVPCASPNIIESKSFKLYLNGFNQTRFESAVQVHDRLINDLSHAAGMPVEVEVLGTELFHKEIIQEPDGIDLDVQDIEISQYEPDSSLLRLRTPTGLASENDTQSISESVYSRLLKSNCPVTQQPDWGCVQISYTGRPIDHAGLLQYIVSFRMHNGFHENCVERIFVDLIKQCNPTALSVYARYTRRGGLDINPWRATSDMTSPALTRSARQ